MFSAEGMGHYEEGDTFVTCTILAALPRSESTPGLVESSGMIPLEEMWVSPMPLYPHGHNSPESK